MKLIERRIEALEAAEQEKRRERDSGYVVYKHGESLEDARIRCGFGPEARLVFIPEKARPPEENAANWVEPVPHPG